MPLLPTRRCNFLPFNPLPPPPSCPEAVCSEAGVTYSVERQSSFMGGNVSPQASFRLPGSPRYTPIGEEEEIECLICCDDVLHTLTRLCDEHTRHSPVSSPHLLLHSSEHTHPHTPIRTHTNRCTHIL
jgi:hypothetical protein